MSIYGTDNKQIKNDARILTLKLCGDLDVDCRDPSIPKTTIGTGVDPTAAQLAAWGLTVYAGMFYYHSTDNVWRYYTGSAWANMTGSVGSLDDAYNGGTTITVDGTALTLTGSHATNDTFFVNKTTGSGDAIQVTNAGTGKDINGTSNLWSFTKAGVLDCDGATIDGALTVNDGSADVDVRIESNNMQYAIYSDGGKDSVVLGSNSDTSSADKLVNITRAARTATANIPYADLYVAPAGAVTIPAGTTATVASVHIKEPNITATGTVTLAASLYVDGVPTEGAAGANYAAYFNGASYINGATTIVGNSTVTGTWGVTGNSTFTGDVAITGGLTFGGALTISDTVTVDELILDTDGAAPAGTNAYLVSDNTGDVTINCKDAKTINLAANGTDEYAFGQLAVDLNGNHLDNAGYLIMNAVTLPGGTEVYVGHDNTGDLTLNCKTGKTVNVAIAGTDEYVFAALTLDMNANAIDNCGYVILNAATAPAGSEVYAVNDNTGDLTLNALTGKSVHVAINGTDEYSMDASNLILASGNKIKFAGDDGIVDSNGNELLEFAATGSATNGLKIINAATANPVQISAQGTGATANRGIELMDSNGAELLELASVGSALNEIGIVNAITGVKPTIRAQGEGDLGMILANFDGTNTEEILILAATATGVNEITITNQATGANPSIAATGDDADIHLALAGKGTGGIYVSDDVVYGSIASHTADTADACLYLSSTAHATKGFVCVPAGDGGLIVGSDGSADRDGTVGTNAIHIFNGTAPVGALVNGVSIYSAAGELYTMDAAGNTLLNSPHSDDGDVVLHSYSAKKDKTVRFHLEKLLRDLIATDSTKYGQYYEEVDGKKHNKEW